MKIQEASLVDMVMVIAPWGDAPIKQRFCILLQ